MFRDGGRHFLSVKQNYEKRKWVLMITLERLTCVASYDQNDSNWKVFRFDFNWGSGMLLIKAHVQQK